MAFAPYATEKSERGAFLFWYNERAFGKAHRAMPRIGTDNLNPPPRSAVKPGIAVWIIEKKHYGTANYKQGIVQEVLSSVSRHPRGIKVRLTDGTIGRVQWLMSD